MSNSDPRTLTFSVKSVDDTSLAVPSQNEHKSREQRVKEQLQTVKRTKTRHSSSGRSLSVPVSPSSPVHLKHPVFYEYRRSQSSPSNNVFHSNGVSKSLNGSSVPVRKQTVSSVQHQESQNRGLCSFPGLGLSNSSRSVPGLAWSNNVQRPSHPQVSPSRLFPPLQRKSTVQQWGNRSAFVNMSAASSRYVRPMAPQPQLGYAVNGSSVTHTKIQQQLVSSEMNRQQIQHTVTDGPSVGQKISGTNGNIVSSAITMKEAVQFLSSADYNYQLTGASYIHHNTHSNAEAKEEVLQLKGIFPLVRLLSSPNSQVKLAASGTLRNLSYKHEKNKQEIQRCEGIPAAVAQLKESNSIELDKQLIGLLWNLSSVDNLKVDLLKNALPVLVERGIQPNMTGSSEASKDPDVFFYTTECLRNLSSGKENSRQRMRKHQGLIDSLAAYIKDCVEKGRMEDASLKNCIGILHNLTFQLDKEFPEVFTYINALASNQNRSISQNNLSAVSCFGVQSKPAQMEPTFDYPVIENPQPKGAGLLIHSETLKDYLALIDSSESDELLETCSGTLQNLTSQGSLVCSVMSQIIVRKLNGMKTISPLIKSRKVNLQKNILSLVVNMTKNPTLQSAIGRTALPQLLDLLIKGPPAANESDDNLALACQAVASLLLTDSEWAHVYLNHNLIQSLNGISQNPYLRKAKDAASILLVKIWSHKEFQTLLKKQGMNKSMFCNDHTLGVHRSSYIVD